MSVERVERKDGTVVWRVRWRNRSKVRARKRYADVASSGGGCTASRTSRARTLQVYAVQWDAHILPRLAEILLRELTPGVVNDFRLELQTDGSGLLRSASR